MTSNPSIERTRPGKPGRACHVKHWGRMRWTELGLSALFGALFTAFYFLPGSWCEPAPVLPLAGIFVVAATMFYLNFVDDERRPLVGAWHRIFVGAMLGYIGFRCLTHVPL